MYNNILGICEEMGRISSRVSGLETEKAAATSIATESVATFVGKELATQVDTKIRLEMERLLDARFQGVLDTQLDSKLDSMFDMKLDTKVSVAVRRERAFLEASVEESVKKAIVEMIDARLRSIQLANENAAKGAATIAEEAAAAVDASLRAIDAHIAEINGRIKAIDERAPSTVAADETAADDPVIIVPKTSARKTTRKAIA